MNERTDLSMTYPNEMTLIITTMPAVFPLRAGTVPGSFTGTIMTSILDSTLQTRDAEDSIVAGETGAVTINCDPASFAAGTPFGASILVCPTLVPGRIVAGSGGQHDVHSGPSNDLSERDTISHRVHISGALTGVVCRWLPLVDVEGLR